MRAHHRAWRSIFKSFKAAELQDRGKVTAFSVATFFYSLQTFVVKYNKDFLKKWRCLHRLWKPLWQLNRFSLRIPLGIGERRAFLHTPSRGRIPLDPMKNGNEAEQTFTYAGSLLLCKEVRAEKKPEVLFP